MSLVLPGSAAFTYCVDNMAGVTPIAATPGTNFTWGGANSEGTTTALLAATTRDVHYVVIGIAGVANSGEDNSALFDVLADPAGGSSYGAWITNLVCGFNPVNTAGAVGMTCWYHFPLWLPSGSSLACRGQKAGATGPSTGRCVIYLFGEPRRPDMWWCGQAVESLGINNASSTGTAITPGNTGAWGSWGSIGTSTRRYGALQMGLGGSDATMLAVSYHFQYGIGSAQMPGTPTLYASCTTTEAMHRINSGPIFCDVAASTALQARGTCSGTAENQQVAFYGVY